MKHTKARGAFLGLLFVLSMVAAAPLRLSAAYEAVGLMMPGGTGELPRLALGAAAALPVGAFLGALPGRIRQRKSGAKRASAGWKPCAAAFTGGFVLLAGAGLAGGDLGYFAMGGAGAGTLSGWAALVLMLGAGMAAARLRGRRDQT